MIKLKDINIEFIKSRKNIAQNTDLMEAGVNQKDEYGYQVIKRFRADIKRCENEEGLNPSYGDSVGQLMVYERSISVQFGIVSSGS